LLDRSRRLKLIICPALMNLHPLDLAIVLVYLAVMVVLGFWVSANASLVSRFNALHAPTLLTL